MKRNEKPLTMDEAVEKLAAITQKTWAKFTPEEQARNLRNFRKFMVSLKKKERAKPSRSPRVPSGRRRALTRG
jgi:hypothetical protein